MNFIDIIHSFDSVKIEVFRRQHPCVLTAHISVFISQPNTWVRFD